MRHQGQTKIANHYMSMLFLILCEFGLFSYIKPEKFINFL
ncbi:hypothetical protein KNP414_02830 [Paenibacillus mucilaginosus KNP414]|uniref:Uncharacterized protein n=1 Tax=Paenibacillus mucilaginosus (strain KNP414) TaxID=1036673 RepID=F8FCX3_PAEMK|nr:hypothetical protein KNP414_02830 [Paenibacillus mucilaginosus KNP414]